MCSIRQLICLHHPFLPLFTLLSCGDVPRAASLLDFIQNVKFSSIQIAIASTTEPHHQPQKPTQSTNNVNTNPRPPRPTHRPLFSQLPRHRNPHPILAPLLLPRRHPHLNILKIKIRSPTYSLHNPRRRPSRPRNRHNRARPHHAHKPAPG